MKTLSEIVFASLKDRSLTPANAEMMLALDTVKKIDYFRPRPYPGIAVATGIYIDQRLSGFAYDPMEFRRIGEFTYTIRKIESANYSEYLILNKAAQTLSDNNQSELASKLLTKAAMYKRFDRELLKKLYQVQAMDSEEKQRSLYR